MRFLIAGTPTFLPLVLLVLLSLLVLTIGCGAIFAGGVYLLMKWLLRRGSKNKSQKNVETQ